MKERANKNGPIAKATWATETYDMIKDVNLLYQFKHMFWTKWIMILSIVIPFSLTDADKAKNGVMHNLIMYLGITKT